MTTSKVCSICKTEQPISEFYRHPETRDRLYPYCKPCMKLRSKEWKRAHATHGEKFQLKQQGFRRCTQCHEVKPDTSEAFSILEGRTSSPCRVCVSAYNKARYVPKVRKPAKGRDMEKRFISRKAGKARKAGAMVVDLTVGQWAALKELYDFSCAYCGQAVAVLTMDHIRALTRGGQHTATNVVPACMSCNQRKHNGPPPSNFTPRPIETEGINSGG